MKEISFILIFLFSSIFNGASANQKITLDGCFETGGLVSRWCFTEEARGNISTSPFAIPKINFGSDECKEDVKTAINEHLEAFEIKRDLKIINKIYVEMNTVFLKEYQKHQKLYKEAQGIKNEFERLKAIDTLDITNEQLARLREINESGSVETKAQASGQFREELTERVRSKFSELTKKYERELQIFTIISDSTLMYFTDAYSGIALKRIPEEGEVLKVTETNITNECDQHVGMIEYVLYFYPRGSEQQVTFNYFNSPVKDKDWETISKNNMCGRNIGEFLLESFREEKSRCSTSLLRSGTWKSFATKLQAREWFLQY